jgi:CubicO group peptidase (beta-lactamase class C family)
MENTSARKPKTGMTVAPNRFDFSHVHAVMQKYVDQDLLPGISSAVLVGGDLVDVHCCGWADREAKTKLGVDHIFRIFSNTKLITSCAVLLLYEEGCFQLDDPIENTIPQLGNRLVLRPGATDPSDVEPAAGPITIRHLLTHSSGLSYGLLDPGTLMFKLYTEHGVLSPNTPLSGLMDALNGLPLSFHPGTSWEYSVAADVLARLVEIISGQRFDEFLRARILAPLGMDDTGFVVPPADRHRFAAHYAGADLQAPLKPGLTRLEDVPHRGAYLQPFPRLSGGGGLVSTLPDMVAMLRALVPGDDSLLKRQTLELIYSNQLRDGLFLRFPRLGVVPGKGYGLVGAVTLAPLPDEPPQIVGEIQWGGTAGTHWWIHPQHDLSVAIMTQRHMAFWHPFVFELKRQIYATVLA